MKLEDVATNRTRLSLCCNVRAREVGRHNISFTANLDRHSMLVRGGAGSCSSCHYRVLFVTHSAQFGGAENSLLDILSRIDRELSLPFVLLPETAPVGRDELRNINVPYARA